MINHDKQMDKNIKYFQCARRTLGNEIPTFSYLVDGVLIDTGPRRLGPYYQEKFSREKIEGAIATHHHEDHVGNAAFLAKKGIPIYIHHSQVEMANKKTKIPFYRWLFWGSREPFQALSLPKSLETAKGKKVEIIETPGHTEDHISCFVPSEGAVFTGDLFVNAKTKLGMPGEDYFKWMDSLERLLKLDFDTIYCSHSGMIKDGRKAMAKKVELLKELQGRVLELKEKGLGLKEIDKTIFPKTLPITYFSGGEWDSIHIISSLMMEE